MTEKNKFRTKRGWVTSYGIACGYIERFEHGAATLELWHEGGPSLHVRLHIHGSGNGRIFWECFDKLGDARKFYSKTRTQLKRMSVLQVATLPVGWGAQ